MRIEFVCKRGALAGKSFEFEAGPILMGRNPACQLQFDPHQDILVSGHHCEVFQQENAWFVRDTNSKHGTLLNGQTLTAPPPLNDGDSLQLGRNGPELRVGLSGPVPATSPSKTLIKVTGLSGSLIGKSLASTDSFLLLKTSKCAGLSREMS